MSTRGGSRITIGILLLQAVLAIAVIPLALAAQNQPADIIVSNARIYTVNSKQPWAEAIAIRDGKILAVGKAEDVSSYRGTSTKVLDAENHLILPGFTDSHVHFIDGSLSLERIVLDDAKTIEEIQKRVKTYAASHPNAAWIRGRGWVYGVFSEGTLPDKKYLDAVVPDRPVYLECFDGHTWWANSKALALAGIDRNTPDPPSGMIGRDPKTGEPTGTLKEDSADGLMQRVLPQPSVEERRAAYLRGMREANQVGIVRVHSAGGVSVGGSDFENAGLLDEIRRSGQLTVRMYLGYRVSPPELTATDLDKIEDLRRRYHDEWISGGAAKFFLDGVIETHTAVLVGSYADEPGHNGQLWWDRANYEKAVRELDRRGIQVFSHAVGEGGVRVALDTYEKVAKANGTKDARHRIEHIETVTAEDIPRFGKLNVIASMQPLHAYPDDDIFNVWLKHAGKEREPRAWAWQSIASSGGHLAFGSDWPVVTINPWQGMQNALTRQTWDGKPAGGWVPEQRVTLAQAIEGYTLGAAYGGHLEKTEGSLEPGKVADLIVLSQDLFKIDPHKIADTEVLLTMVGGKIVYQSGKWAPIAQPTSAGKQ